MTGLDHGDRADQHFIAAVQAMAVQVSAGSVG